MESSFDFVAFQKTWIDESVEIYEIFAIVIRNLIPDHWQNLILEAQLQMVEEVSVLLGSLRISVDRKQQLLYALERLQMQGMIQDGKLNEVVAMVLKQPVGFGYPAGGDYVDDRSITWIRQAG